MSENTAEVLTLLIIAATLVAIVWLNTRDGR